MEVALAAVPVACGGSPGNRRQREQVIDALHGDTEEFSLVGLTPLEPAICVAGCQALASSQRRCSTAVSASTRRTVALTRIQPGPRD